MLWTDHKHKPLPEGLALVAAALGAVGRLQAGHGAEIAFAVVHVAAQALVQAVRAVRGRVAHLRRVDASGKGNNEVKNILLIS